MHNRLAVVFDMDGVIVDTTSSLCEIYMNILDGFGVKGSRDEFDRLNGCSLDEIVAHLTQRHCLVGEKNELRHRFEASFGKLYTQCNLMIGILAVLETLRKHAVTICIASSSSQMNIHTALRRFDLSRFFDFIVSGDEVARAKPHPDIYNVARERCKCNEIFVIEDSLNGIKAAKRAGLIVIHYNSGRESIRQEASYTIRDLSDISRIVLEDIAVVVSMAERIEITRDERPHQLTKQEEQRADEIWSEALRGSTSLFNGVVASYRSHEMLPTGTLAVACYRSQYKHVFAQLRDQSLCLAKPIGVSAVVIDKSGRALIGKRSEHVSEYGGYYEFVPSGGITVPNMIGTMYLEQIKTELLEETGIDAKNIDEIKPFSLIYDRTNGVFDICVKVVLDCDFDPETLTSNEYASLASMDVGSLEHFFSRECIVPTSQAMFRAMTNGVQ